MKLGINLLWVKPQKSGGIEAYIRNLLDGFTFIKEDKVQRYILFVSNDNFATFKHYLKDSRFKIIKCKVESNNAGKRIIWENFYLDKLAKKEHVDCMFIPVYSKPLFTSKKIPYITVIHDLQALHYPQYFSKIKYIWLKYAWKRTLKTSEKIVAISKYVKSDIVAKYEVSPKKVEVIYNPIKYSEKIKKTPLLSKHCIKKEEFFYTVSSLLPHKNLKTLILTMESIVKKNLNLPKKLLISGVGGAQSQELQKLINTCQLEENIIFTGFVTDEERDYLYKSCYAFLFPSIFEGFGMPVIEAMKQEAIVVTTKETSIPEVSQGKALYVNNPYSIDDWINTLLKASKKNVEKIDFDLYTVENISRQYNELFIKSKKRELI